MGSKGQWKEANFRRPYYELYTAIEDSPLDSNWHGVPIAHEELTIMIPPEYLEENPLPPPRARIVVSFEDKLCVTRLVSG
jgi:hypothetical protein